MVSVRYMLALGAVCCLCLAGCSDDSNSGGGGGGGDKDTPKSCSCDLGQICNDSGECVDDPDQQKPPVTGDECNPKCKGNQTCEKGKCVDKGADIPEVCKPGCTSEQTCTDKGCVNLSEICDPECTGDRVCKENSCVFDCDVHCGDSCCDAGQVCDAVLDECADVCGDGNPKCNGICCESNESCVADLGCAENCSENQQLCRVESEGYGYCCDQGYLCDSDSETGCTIDCGERERCQGACCAEGQTCLNGEACKTKCAESQIRCGADQNTCCDGASEICIFNKCLAKGKACADSNECNLDEFCDPASGTCVKASESPNVCEYRPKVGEFKPKVKWHYEDSVHGTPIVINLTDDNGDGLVNEKDIPDVVYADDNRILHALSGDTGKLLAKTPDKIYNGLDDISAADVDNDGVIEVLVPSLRTDGNKNLTGLNVMILVKQDDGGYLWQQKKFIHADNFTPNTNTTNIYADLHPEIADLNEDGQPEIITTRGVIDTKTWEFTCNYILPRVYDGNGAYVYMQVVADLDQDNESEIIAHNVYDKDCNIIIPESEKGWRYAAVADLLEDENASDYPGELTPEIVRVAYGKVSVWKVYVNKDASGNKVWTQSKIWESNVVDNKGKTQGGGGNPVIADFDGDHKPDIGVATYDYYIVFNGQSGKVMWTTKTQDHTSNSTGSTVFDFDGDGIAEVIYRDETKLRIYSGPGGEIASGDTYRGAKVLFEVQNTSGTIIEYPLVADVDNDGKSELLVGSNKKDWTPAGLPLGMTVYTDTYNNWVRTRRIWNQHAYHVTNINEDGTVPQHEEANWLSYNNYRQNVQPEGAFNAPNFVAGALESKVSECSPVELVAHVRNEGSFGVKAGLPVNFYVVDPKVEKDEKEEILSGEHLIGTALTEGPLSPSGETTAVFVWDRKVTVGGVEYTLKKPVQILFWVDQPGEETPTGVYAECHEDDNRSVTANVEGCSVL